MEVGSHEKIGRRLRGRIRAIGFKRIGFAKRRIIRCQRAVDFVSRHMQKAKRLLGVTFRSLRYRMARLGINE